jgi:hypothetical protein
MPRRKDCQHPTRHAKSASAARGDREVSLELSHFLRDQFGPVNDPIKWLCRRCHSSETKTMQSRSINETSDRRNLSNHKLSSDHPVEDEEDDDHTRESEDNDEDDEDEQSSIDDDMSITNSGDEIESMDEDPVDDAASLSYQQDEAMKKLSEVFKVLNLGPIHSR